MPENMSYMLVINLHETHFLEETLDILSEEFARDIVVYNAEGIASRHGNELPNYNFFAEGLSNILQSNKNKNYVILSVLDKTHKPKLGDRLKKLQLDERWAASYWFIAIESYFYHKGNKNI